LKVMLILDEGAALGNWKSLQTKSVKRLRTIADRRVLLDGTPVGNSPMEQFSKFSVLGDDVLGYPNFWAFRARHAVIRRVPWTKSGQVVGFKDQAKIDARVKPYCEYLSQDGLDLPEKIPTFITAHLTEKTWRVYRQLRDELVADLERGTLLVQHAAVKSLRLAQLCAGFLGGFVNDETQESETEEVGRETLDAFLGWVSLRLAENDKFKCVVWCRWRPEIERLQTALAKFKELRVGVKYGGYQDENFLHPDHTFAGAGVMVCQPQAAKFGVNFSKADTEVFLSQDYDRVSRSQSEERVQLIGARRSTLVVDVLVRGPQGQRTIVDDVYAVLHDKENVATRTVQAWKKSLTEE
jgi:hypothetical protein